MLANKVTLDLLTWEGFNVWFLLTETLSFRISYIPFTQTFKAEGMSFLRLVLKPQDGSEQHFPNCFLGNLRCTSRKGFCGQLIWEILLNKISPLKTHNALEHLNIYLPCKSIIHSSPLLCLHMGRVYFLAPWRGVVMWLAFVNGIWANIMCTISKQKL